MAVCLGTGASTGRIILRRSAEILQFAGVIPGCVDRSQYVEELAMAKRGVAHMYRVDGSAHSGPAAVAEIEAARVCVRLRVAALRTGSLCAT